MQNRLVTAAGLAVLVGSIAGCSSSTPAAPARPPGAPPVGTAQVTVDAADAATVGAVNCTQAESLVTITAGDNASGMTAVVDLATKPTVKSVSIHNLGGFTGSYWQDLGPAAQVRTGTQAYQISGTVDGFHVNDPSFRKTETFAIKVAC
jgi:ipoprotein LpqH